MKPDEIEDAVAMVARLASAMADYSGQAGRRGADYRRALGVIEANAEHLLRGGLFGDALLAAFEAGRVAGLTAENFAAIRAAAIAEQDLGPRTGIVVAAFIRLSLVMEALVRARATYGSRDEVGQIRDRMRAAFDAAIEAAADAGDVDVMRDLVTLNAALQRHLMATAVPLPRVVRYTTPLPLPSLVLAHRLYGEASRRDQLVRENGVRHPLWMPAEGRAFSA